MRRSASVVAVLALVACAHAPVQPIVVTSHVLDGAGLLFESTNAGMVAASKSGAISREQAIAWNDFTVRWAAGYGVAVERWIAAKNRLDLPAAEQAAAMLTGLLTELGAFQIVAMGART